MSDLAFSLQHVRCTLGDGPRLYLDQWEVNQGDQWTLTGPSGCGKSSLLSIIAGVLPVEDGGVSVLGENMRELSVSKRDQLRGRDVGLIFQNFNLLEPFTALENVLLGLRFAGKNPDPAVAEDLLAHVGLGHRLQAKPASLSIGERQRVAVARALAPQPALLLADEPTGSLDPKTSLEVCELIQSMCSRQKTSLVFVTHDEKLTSLFDLHFDASSLLKEEAG